MFKSLFILSGIAALAVGCGRMSALEPLPTLSAKSATTANSKNEVLTPLSVFYGDYTTLTHDEKPVVDTIGPKAEPTSCDTWAKIANSPISVPQTPWPGELVRTMTNSREYYDAKTKQPIRADSIWIHYGAHETSLGCNGGVDFLAFADRGSWTASKESVEYKFNGTLLKKIGQNEFAEEQYGIDSQIERVENGNLNVRFKIQIDKTRFQGEFILKKK